MEISKEITVKLTTKEVEEIVIKHLKLKGIDVQSVYFNINGHNREDDWRAEFPLDYRLDNVICRGTILETPKVKSHDQGNQFLT